MPVIVPPLLPSVIVRSIVAPLVFIAKVPPLSEMPEVLARLALPPTDSTPLRICVVPEKVLVPESVVTVPAPDFVSPTPPARFAEASPVPSIVNPLVLVSVPVPAIVPLVSVTAPTESEKVERLSTPPLTVTAPVLRALFTPYPSVPALTVVRPV